METNGQRSCSDKSRHIHIRYFFVKDISEQEQIKIKHCPTKRMIADYFTKPLQGSLFKKLRNIIMGATEFPAEERVGDRADDLITAKTSERKNVGDNYLQLLSATKRKLTRVSNFNMSKMRGWRHKRRVWDCNT